MSRNPRRHPSRQRSAELVAWLPPKSGVVSCERCSRETAVVVDGWIRVDVMEEGDDEPKSYDFCPLCKIYVQKALRAISKPRTVARLRG